MNVEHIDISNLDGISINMHEESSFDLIINDQVEIHIRKNFDGVSVDLYKHISQDDIDEDHDFDNDLLASCYAFDSDYLNDSEEG